MMHVLFLSLFLTNVDSRPALTHAVASPSLVVCKAKRELQLYSRGALVRTYQIGLGLDPVSPKERQGDWATPEGRYFICRKNPQSKYDFSLAISYPGPNDAMRGQESGLITTEQRDRIIEAWVRRTTPPQNTALGGEIMIHGRGSSSDWTWGCVALDYPDIEELYRVVPIGTPVDIVP
jgi:murein L,D-transpeptidase YafK